MTLSLSKPHVDEVADDEDDCFFPEIIAVILTQTKVRPTVGDWFCKRSLVAHTFTARWMWNQLAAWRADTGRPDLHGERLGLLPE